MRPVTVKTRARPRSGPVPNQPPISSTPAPVVMNGMATNWATGLIRNAVSGDAAISTLCANPNTRPWRSKGTTFCSTVCSAASANGTRHNQTNMPTASSRIHERSVNTLDTAHITTLTASNVRSGFAPSPRRATIRPPTMNPALSTPNSRPHTSTDTSESP